VLSLWKTSDPVGPALTKAIGDFEAATGWKVKLVEAGEELVTEYEATVAAGSEADVVIVNLAEQSAAWVANGAAIPVNDLLTDWGLDQQITAAAIADWTNADGQVQGFPFSGFVWPVWYNTALLAQAGVDGVPASADELIAAAGKLREAGIGPVVVGGNDWSGNKLFLQIIQSYLPADEARTLFSGGGYCASENAMKGIELFAQLRDGGVFVDGVEGYTADAMNAAFYEGKAAIMPAGSWAMPGTPEALLSDVQLGGFPVPADAAFSKPTAYQGNTGVGFFVSPNGEQKLDAVKAFVSGFYTPEIIGMMVSDAAVVPTTTTDVSGTVASANPLLAQAVTTLPAAVEFATFPDTYVGARAEALTGASALAYSAGKSAAEICAAADAAYQ
jgi:multiple sugar transport system substrate-binding protein